VADDLRIPDRLERLQAVLPYYALAIQPVGPERALHLFATGFEPKPDKIVEVPVRHLLNIKENWDAGEL